MEINRMHQTGTVPITCLSGWLCSKCHSMYSWEREQQRQAEGFHVSNFTVVSLLRSVFFLGVYFHGYLSHPLRLRQGGVLSEPKCPSVCSGKYSLGIKPKPQASTPWNNSPCHSSEICHYNLLNFRSDWQGDKSSGPDAACLFWVMKSRFWGGLWPFNQSPVWFSMGLSAHLASLHRGEKPWNGHWSWREWE